MPTCTTGRGEVVGPHAQGNVVRQVAGDENRTRGGGGGVWQEAMVAMGGRGWNNWASRTRKRGETCGGQPERGGEWAESNRKTTPAASSTTPVRQPLGSANAETTAQGIQSAAAVRTH